MKNRIMNRVALAVVGLCAVGIVAWTLSGRSMGMHRATALPSAELQESQPAVPAAVPSVALAQDVAQSAPLAIGASVVEPSHGVQTAVRPRANANEAVGAMADGATNLGKMQDRYASNEVLDEKIGPADAQGRYERVRIVQTDMKYPLVRVVDRWEAKTEDGGRRTVDGGQESGVRGESVQSSVFSVQNPGVLSPASGVPPPSTLHRPPATLLSQTAMVADHVTLKVKEGTTEADLAAYAQANGGTILRKLRVPGPGTYLVKMAEAKVDTVPQALAALAQADAPVEYVNPDYVVYALETVPNDAQFGDLWGMKNIGQSVKGDPGKSGADIKATQAWDLTTGSRNVLVAVIDTGIDYTHEDLAANMWNNPGETGLDAAGNDKRTNKIDDDANGFIDDWHGWNFFNDDNDSMDDHSHGTHCAGTIGGVGNNGIGVAGVCWNVSLVGLKFLSAKGSGTESDGMEAVYYATKIGAKLTSNSWGGGGSDPGLKEAIADAGAHGILFVAAAGNEAKNNDGADPNYPSSEDCSNIVAVAATDNDDALASFSCYGKTSVDLGAPGVNILSSVLRGSMMSFGNGYAFYNGTSMATPHVAGACALLASVAPSWTAAEIKARLLESVDPIPALAGKCVTGGRLNIGRAAISPTPLLRLAGASVSDPAGNADGIVNPGETVQVTVALRNVSMATISGVHATVSCSDPLVTVIDGAATFGNISALGEKQALYSFVLAISPTCPTPHEVTLSLNMTDAGTGVWTDSFKVMVYNSYKISGVVKLDGAPAAGVTIEYQGTMNGTSVTDNQGQYMFGGIDGTYTLKAMKAGWRETASVPVTVGPSRSGVNFAFTTATVAGQVTDKMTGNAMQGVAVEYGNAVSGAVTTATDGRYAFTRVYGQITTLTLTAKKAGFFDMVKTVTVPPNASGVNFVMVFSDIDVVPTSLVVNAIMGDKPTRTLTIRNLGTTNLDWNINPPGRVIRKFADPDFHLSQQQGIAFDGSALWVLGDAYNNSAWLHKLDAETGKTLADVMLPSFTNGISSELKGLAWDGANLWTTETIFLKSGKVEPGSHRGQILAVNPVTGEIVKTLDLGGDALLLYGVAVDGGHLWVAGRVSSTTVQYRIWKLDPRTGAVVATIPSSINYGLDCFGGAFWTGRGGGGNPRISKLNMQTGAEIEQFPMPYGNGEWVFDVAHAVGRNMWALIQNQRGISVWGEAYLVDSGTEPWMEEAPRSGTVAAGGSQQVTLSLDTLAAGLGTHETSLRIVSNDPDEPETLVPVKFTVSPNPNNRAPIIAEGTSVNVTMSEDGKPTPFNLTLHSTDADNDTLVWSVATAPNPGAAVAIGTGPTMPITYQPAHNQFGTDRFVVQVSDGKGAQDAIVVNVTIVGTNEPPTVTMEASATIGVAPLTVAFTVVGQDPDNDTLRYAWDFGDGSTSEPQSVGNATHTYTKTGAFRAVVTVTDPLGLLAQAPVTITVWTSAEATGPALHAWGWNVEYQVGGSNNGMVLKPMQVPGLFHVSAVSGGSYGSFAVKSDGTVFAWGNNEYGQLGDGTRINRRTPVQVMGAAGSTAIAVGSSHALVLKGDASVWAWGYNGGSAIGDGTMTDRLVPVKLTGVTGVTAIAAGLGHSLAVQADGSVWAWGSNDSGQLGDGTTTNRTSPVKISGLSGVTRVAGGVSHSLAVKAEGSVWAWGSNDYGQLGDGTKTRRLKPVRVKMADGTWLSGVIAVGAGGGHSIALKGDGSVWAWGGGKYGQLGNGSVSAYQPTPVQVSMAGNAPLSGVTRISCGVDHALVQKGDGSVWAWGWNYLGAIGDGTRVDRNVAVPVSDLSGGLVVGCGGYHSLAVTGNGTANQAPVANAQPVTTAEDTAKTITLAGSDPEGSNLTFAVVAQPAHGTLSGMAPSVTYKPDANYNGVDSFTFKVNDGVLDSAAATVTITVTAVNDAPTCALTAPANGATFAAPASITIQASASDVDGTIAKVEFFNGATKLGEATTTPYAFTWSSVAAGSYTLTAKATDNSGATKTSAARSVTVTATANQPPVITEGTSAPVTMSEDGAPPAFSLTLHATDANTNTLTWSISTAAAHGTATASGTGLSKAISYAPAANYVGSDSFVVTVSDGNGGTDTITVNVTIQAVNDAPTCALTAPANGATYTVPASIALQATASDVDGTITKVEFFNGATKLGEDTTTPYAYIWSGVAAGSYTLTAKATDNSGAITTSAGVNITVTTAANQPPVAMAGVNPTSGTTTNEFYFWGTQSHDPDGTIIAYEWRIAGALVSTNAECLHMFATGGTYTVTLTVRDNAGASDSDGVVVNVSAPVPSMVSVTTSDALAGEPGLAEGTGKFIVSRSGDLTQAITVNYAMSGKAVNGMDYTKLSGTVTLAAGKASVSVTLTPLPDALAEGDETAIMTLLTGTGYAMDGANSVGTVTIKDQTYGKPVVTAVATDPTAAEPGLTVNKGAIKVSRTGSCDQALTVKATLGGTASNGVDYTPVTVPVTLAIGQSSKVLTIAPLADGIVEP